MSRRCRAIEILALFGALVVAPASAQRIIKPPTPIGPTKGLEPPRVDTRINSGFDPNVRANVNVGQGVNTTASPSVASSAGSSNGGSSSTNGDETETVSIADGPDPNDQAIDDYLNRAGANFIESLPTFGKLRHVY